MTTTGPTLTTFTAPESGNAECPWRYVIGYSHRTGFGNYVLDSYAPPTGGDFIVGVVRQIERKQRCRNVVILGMTLVAAPAGQATQVVAVSTATVDPYQYMVSFRHQNGYGVQIQDSPRPITTSEDVEWLRNQIRVKNGGIDNAVLSLLLMTAPANQ